MEFGRSMGFAEGLVIGAMLRNECGFTLFTKKAGGDGNRPARVQHMHHGLTVVRSNFDSGVFAAGGGSRQPVTAT